MSTDEGFVGTNKWAIVKSALMKYTGSSFIRELIQNAEDAGNEAKEKVIISFDFKESELVVENNMKFKGDWDNLDKNISELGEALYEDNLEKSNKTREKLKEDDWIRINFVRGGLKALCNSLSIGKF